MITGLKCPGCVAPLVGAWIEIVVTSGKSESLTVAPLVGAWIEISMQEMNLDWVIVAPLVGAWIEILAIIL